MKPLQLTLKSAQVVHIMLEDPAQPRYQLELMKLAHLGSGTLYYILARLIEAGWLTREKERPEPGWVQDRPLRMMYTLTPEGAVEGRRQLAAIAQLAG